jgi:uncharacterized protein YndB with AHSA1/START domain
MQGKGNSTSRLLDAPIQLVWEVWTNPNHIKNWWGPTGFTNTILKFNFSIYVSYKKLQQ